LFAREAAAVPQVFSNFAIPPDHVLTRHYLIANEACPRQHFAAGLETSNTRQQPSTSSSSVLTMATRKANLSGVHTSGIFADMSVDGPKIGTLVVVVDRAKNLPNRRTMGKQDPYCAARLGKEAKKTTTDRRGGQVPRW